MNKCETETFTHGFTSCLQLLLTMMMIYHPSYLITYQLVKNWTDLLWLVCIQDQSLTLTGCGVEFCLSHSPAPFNIMHSKTHLLAYIACRTSVKQWQVSERMLIYIPVKETVGSVKMVLAESFKLTGLMSLAEHSHHNCGQAYNSFIELAGKNYISFISQVRLSTVEEDPNAPLTRDKDVNSMQTERI